MENKVQNQLIPEGSLHPITQNKAQASRFQCERLSHIIDNSHIIISPQSNFQFTHIIDKSQGMGALGPIHRWTRGRLLLLFWGGGEVKLEKQKAKSMEGVNEGQFDEEYWRKGTIYDNLKL